jgi:maleylacetoacetate isomerase
MKLYGYWRSGATWRVRIALAWKGLPYDYQPVNLLSWEQNEDPYRRLNLMQAVPLLEWHEGEAIRRLAQSLAIIDYLDQRFPTPPLLPTDPWLRARARQLAEIVNSGIQPFQGPTVLKQVKDFGGDEKAWVHFFHLRGLTALEEETSRTAGSFSVGDAPSIADCCLVPQLYASRRFKVDLTPYPTLTRIEAACEALPAFQAAHPDRQPDAQHAPR